MSLKIYRDADGVITQLKTGEGRFSYTYLTTTKPPFVQGSDEKPVYATDLIVDDEETIAAIKTYLNEIISDARTELWAAAIKKNQGRLPAGLHLPFRVGDEEKEPEAGKYVLSTKSTFQPKLYILNQNTGRAYEVETDEDIEQIYSGMYGEIIVKFKAYAYGTSNGITCYIQSACKTNDGEPLGNRTNFGDEFSLTSDFDQSVDDIVIEKKPASKPVAANKTSAKTAAKTTSKPVAAKPQTVVEESIDIDNLLSVSSSAAEETDKVPTSIEDLLKM